VRPRTQSGLAARETLACECGAAVGRRLDGFGRRVCRPGRSPSGERRPSVGRVFCFGGTHLRGFGSEGGRTGERPTSRMRTSSLGRWKDVPNEAFGRRAAGRVGRVRGSERADPYEKERRRLRAERTTSVGREREVGPRRERRGLRPPARTEGRMLLRGFGRGAGSLDRVVSCRRALRCGSGVTGRDVCRGVTSSEVTNESGNRRVRHTTHSRVPVPRGPQGSRGQVRRRVSQADGCGHTL